MLLAKYAPSGPLTSITFGNGRTQTRAYDQNYAIDAISGTPAGALTLDFEVDVMGNIVEASDSLSPTTPDRVYTYDPMYRLTKAETGATPPVPLEAYTYNPTGDRLSASLNGNPADAYTYVPNTHRLASVGAAARTYDDNGNTLTGLPSGYALSYDDRNRLRQATKPPTNTATYRYNGKGERMVKAVSNGLFATVTAFAYDEGGRLIGEYDDAGNVLAEYVYLDDIPIAVIRDPTPYYVEADHLGTPRQAVDPATNAVLWRWDLLEATFGTSSPHEDPDGNSTAFVLNLRFPGQHHDAETGLNYNYFRDYEPATGRYIESDPIGMFGGINTIVYAAGNPLYLTDMLGLAACGSDCCKNIQWPTRSGDFAAGTVQCCGGEAVVCVNPHLCDGMPSDACRISKKCVKRHEKVHKDNHVNCNGKPETGAPIEPPNTRDSAECEAFREELSCLNISECRTHECVQLIRKIQEFKVIQRDRRCGAAGM